MKNMSDIHDILALELKHWFPLQCRNEWADYYLYYLPTTAEHDGGLVIAKERPANPEYCLVERIRKDLTVEQNCRRLAELARSLPILENEKPE